MGRQFAGVLFDCDGVLVDSEAVTNGVLAEMLRELGWQISDAECVRHFIGYALKDRWQIILEHTGVRIDDDWIAEFRTRRDDRLRVSLREIAGATVAVQAAFTKFSGRIACATGAELAKAQLQLEITGLDRFFEHRIFSGHDQAASKPAPDVYLAAAAAVGIDPAEAIVIEDTVSGVTAGASAGATVLGFTSAGPASTPAEALIAAGAVRVFTDMARLPSVITELEHEAG